MNVVEQYERIIEVYKAVPLDGTVTVLTGPNGSGKSLIRSQLGVRTSKECDGRYVVHSSMAMRTGSHPNMGGLGAMVRDNEWDPTSYATLKSIQKAIQSLRGNYLVLDEIEIGCARETIMAMVDWLNKNLRKGLLGRDAGVEEEFGQPFIEIPKVEPALGCMIVTHSEYVVENLKFDTFLNLDGIETAEEWVNREIKMTDLDELEENSFALFSYVNEQGKKKTGDAV